MLDEYCDPLNATCFVEQLGVDIETVKPQYSFIFEFEEKFDKDANRLWMHQNWHTSFYWAALYVSLIFGIKWYMRNRSAFELKKPLVIWNLLLACFSILGACRTVPELAYVLKKFGFQHSVCNPSFIEYDRVAGFWTWMFVLSKLPELVDTIFIVLRKRELIFLHWYHHVTVLCFSWYFYQQHIAPARWYVVMNYTIHSVMYSYYAARALHVKLPAWSNWSITLLQLTQMVVGFYVTLHAYLTGPTCAIVPQTALWSIYMYLSYFGLFALFFYRAYLSGGRRSRPSPVIGKKAASKSQ